MIKKVVFTIVLIAAVLLVSGGCKDRSGITTKKCIILTFGDSITRGVREGVNENQTFTYYLGLFFKKNNFNVEMIRKGVSGETTSGALNRLEHDVIRGKPHYVTIMYGTNDAFIDNYNNIDNILPRVSIERYKNNLRAIVRKLKANNIKPILMTPIPMGRFWGSDAGTYKKNGSNFLLKDYAATVRDTAREEGVPLVNHFKEWLNWKKRNKDIDNWMTDGVHPNPKGHRLMASTIFKVLKKEMMK